MHSQYTHNLHIHWQAFQFTRVYFIDTGARMLQLTILYGGYVCMPFRVRVIYCYFFSFLCFISIFSIKTNKKKKKKPMHCTYTLVYVCV